MRWSGGEEGRGGGEWEGTGGEEGEEGEWGRRGRSEGGIGKQERDRDGDQKRRRGRKRVEERVGRQEGGGGRAGEMGERVRGKENNTRAHQPVVMQFYLQRW